MTKQEQKAQEIKEAQEVKEVPEVIAASSEDPAAGLADHAAIVIEEPDPKLNPSSPEFDQEAYNKALEEAGGPEAMTRSLQETIQRIGEGVKEAGRALYFGATDTIQAAKVVSSLISDIVNSDAYQVLKDAAATLHKIAIEHGPELEQLQQFYEILENPEEHSEELSFYIGEVLDERGDTMGDLLARIRENGQTLDEAAAEILEEARKRLASAQKAAEIVDAVEQTKEELAELDKVKYIPTEDIKTITDKAANVFYSVTAPAGHNYINGQLAMIPIKYEGAKSKKEITLYYDYTQNEETLAKYGIDKKFSDFDFFVMSTIDNLEEAGNTLVSLTKIYKELGNEGSPNGELLEAIHNSLVKGMSTIITINDKEVQEAWNKRNPNKRTKYQEIISPIIPVQIGSERFLADGKIAAASVRILGPSPFLKVAKPLGHWTAWDKDVLKLYKGKRTQRYYSVLRFLMIQIAWLRNDKSRKRSNKILYSALYEHTGDTGSRKTQLARDMMFRLLDQVFIPLGYIDSYKETATPNPGIELKWSKTRKRIENK